MADVVLIHSAVGLRPAVVRAADGLPDQYGPVSGPLVWRRVSDFLSTC